MATLDGRHAIEFLDGSLWPRERAGTATAASSGGRLPLSDTENSILHSFTDTARRLLAAITTATAPTQVRPAVGRPEQVRRTPDPVRPTATSAGPIADSAANRAAGYAAQAMAEAMAAAKSGS